jgi:hypothetical protein
METTALFVALVFTTGMALTTAFGCGLLPLLSNDACLIVKNDTGQLPHFAALPPSHSRIAKLPELVREY